MAQQREVGVIVTWKPNGYGFVHAREDREGCDLFVHARDVVEGGEWDAGRLTITPGTLVSFVRHDGDRGPLARDVRVEGNAA